MTKKAACLSSPSGNEFAPSHSIIVLARSRNDFGSAIPSALAVRRLITSSNDVGCCYSVSETMPMSALGEKQTCASHRPCPLSANSGQRTRFPIASSGCDQSLVPQTEFLIAVGRRLGLVALAVRRDLCGIFLKAVVVQDFAIGRGIVITAHPKADKIPVFWTVSEPIPQVILFISTLI